jgi:uncharacterized protein (TIGR02246 family)
VKAALDEFAAVWNRSDGAGLGAFFTDDGTLINPFGERAEGSEAVSSMYVSYFGGRLAGTSTEIVVSNVRLVDEYLAFVDGEQTIVAGDGSPVLAVHLAALMRREGGGWRFLDARPYAYASAPG